MEIEIPRRLIGSLVWALLIIVPLLVGWITSPARKDGRPLLLTPRLAQVVEDAMQPAFTRPLLETKVLHRLNLGGAPMLSLIQSDHSWI